MVPSLTCCKEEAEVCLEIAIIHGFPCSMNRHLCLHLPAWIALPMSRTACPPGQASANQTVCLAGTACRPLPTEVTHCCNQLERTRLQGPQDTDVSGCLALAAAVLVVLVRTSSVVLETGGTGPDVNIVLRLGPKAAYTLPPPCVLRQG